METLMVSLDSVKLILPSSGVSADLSRFTKVEKTIPEISEVETSRVSLSWVFPSEKLPYGFKSLSFFPSVGWILEGSSKILKEDYLRGINLNTIERVFDSLSIPSLVIDKNNILENSYVLRCDVTETLVLDFPIDDFLNSIRCSFVNDKFHLNQYSSSLVFQHMGSSVYMRLILYSKKEELMRYKKDEIMMKVLSSLSQNDYLRCETNLKSFSSMKTLFDVKNTSQGVRLLDVLNSKQNPVSKVFDTIIKPSKLRSELFNFSLIERYRDMKSSKVLRNIGLRRIIEDCGFDISRIRSYLLRTLQFPKSDVSKLIPEIKDELLLMMNEKSYERKNILENIEKVREKLKLVS